MKFITLLMVTASMIFLTLTAPKVTAQCTRCGAYEVIVEPYQLTFSAQQVDTTSPSQPVRVTNVGFFSAAVTGITITGPFSETNDCPGELKRGDHCEIQVQFQPRAAGPATGQLTAEAEGVHGASLSGTGTVRSAVSDASDTQVATEHTHYTLIDLGTFGGPQSYLYVPNNYAMVLNNQGTVAGWADTAITPDPFPTFCFNPDCYVSTAFRSWNGTISALDPLSDGFSTGANGISSEGLIAGTAENGSTDPSFPVPGIPVTHAVLWRDKAITDLKTLHSGYQSVGLAVNNRGQVVGAADNGTADPNPMTTDFYGWVTQTRAFLWQDDVMLDLGTLGGTDAVALLINDRGQIVGASYTNSAASAYCASNFGAALTTGAFLYENGGMKNIGGFGGTCTVPTDLNNQGEIIGISTLPGDNYQHAFLWNGSLRDLHNTIGGHNAAAIAINELGNAVGFASVPGDQYLHASIWKNGTMTDLGTVDGDPCSNAYSINANDQIVGVSVPACDFNQSRAVVWEGNSAVDLNTLIPAGSSLYLTASENINDRGEIAGVGVDASGNQHAFLLIPCSSDDCDCQNSAGDAASRPASNSSGPATRTVRGTLRRGLRPVSAIPDPNTSSGENEETPRSKPLAQEPFNQTDHVQPALLDSLDPGVSRSETAPRCGHIGLPCSLPRVYDACCPGLKCVFNGGSTRAGYACEK